MNIFYLRRGFLVEYLKRSTGFTFTEDQVKLLLPTFESLYRRMPPIHTDKIETFWAQFKTQKWHIVDEAGNLGPLKL